MTKLTQKQIAAILPAVQRQYHFTDTAGVQGSCQVWQPGRVYNYAISHKVAENLMRKHGTNLPFEIMYSFGNPDEWLVLSPEEDIPERVNIEICIPLNDVL